MYSLEIMYSRESRVVLVSPRAISLVRDIDLSIDLESNTSSLIKTEVNRSILRNHCENRSRFRLIDIKIN